MIKVWIKSFGFKEYLYFDTMGEAEDFIYQARIDNEDPNCCGICGQEEK